MKRVKENRRIERKWTLISTEDTWTICYSLPEGRRRTQFVYGHLDVLLKALKSPQINRKHLKSKRPTVLFGNISDKKKANPAGYKKRRRNRYGKQPAKWVSYKRKK